MYVYNKERRKAQTVTEAQAHIYLRVKKRERERESNSQYLRYCPRGFLCFQCVYSSSSAPFFSGIFIISLLLLFIQPFFVLVYIHTYTYAQHACIIITVHKLHTSVVSNSPDRFRSLEKDMSSNAFRKHGLDTLGSLNSATKCSQYRKGVDFTELIQQRSLEPPVNNYLL